MAFNFYDVLGVWEEAGVFNVILPFLLVFTIIYTILIKIKILGDNKTSNGVVALIIALLVIRNDYIVGLIIRFLPNVAMFLIIILMFLLLVGTFAGEHKEWKNPLLTISFFVSLIFIIWALASDYLGDWLKLPEWLWDLDETTKATILFIGVFVAIIYFISREETPPASGGGKGMWETIKKGIEDGLKKD